MERAVEERRIAGAVAVVSEQERIIFEQSVGWRDAATETAMTPDTLFRIASMTKPITTVGVMMLHERGQLALSDPVSKYLPEFEAMTVIPPSENGSGQAVPADRAITVHDLLTHTSGLTYGFFGQQPHAARYAES